jgi:hypothetical protein
MDELETQSESNQNDKPKKSMTTADIYPTPTSMLEKDGEEHPFIASMTDAVPNKKSRFYIIKYSLTLFTGWTLTGLLIALSSIVINHLFHIKEYSDNPSSMYQSASMGTIYTLLLSAIIVFCTAHILLNISSEKDNIEPDEKQSKVGKVISIIFAIGLFTTALYCIISFVYPILGKSLGLITIKTKDLIEHEIISLVGIMIIAGMAFYHIKSFKLLTTKMFSAIYVLLTGTLILLFMIFPASSIRDSVHDQSLIDDLNQISTAIDKYASENNKLPSDLADLDIEELNQRLDNYTFAPGASTSQRYSSSRSFSYELCAKGFRTDTEDGGYSGSSNYSFSYHSKGTACFNRSAYTSGIQPVNMYDDSI